MDDVLLLQPEFAERGPQVPAFRLGYHSDPLNDHFGRQPAALGIDAIAAEMTAAFGVSEEAAFVAGDGVRKPVGLFHPTDQGIPAANDVVANPASIDAWIDARLSLRAVYLRSPSLRWVMRPSAFKVAAKLKDSAGAPILSPARRAGDPDPDGDDDEDERVGELATAVRRQLAGPALDALSPGTRKLVEAVVIHRLSAEQIAEQTGQPIKVVRVNLQCAIGQLAKVGRVPADLAGRLGIDVDRLKERTQGGRAAVNVAARRELVREAVVQGVKPEEIAVGLGVPTNTIRIDMRLAKAAIREDQEAAAKIAAERAAEAERERLRAERDARDRAEAARKVAATGKAADRERQVQRAEELLAAGKATVKRIAADLGVNYHTAQNRVQAAADRLAARGVGVELVNEQDAKLAERVRRAADLAAKNLTVSTIAILMKCGENTVKRYLELARLRRVR